ncbi:MAG TPA: transporter [Lachnospiraceae bacterium]|nr:transporter [Lachnospiraceae bacterium]
MFKSITLGQYYPSDSILHKLDPRVKVIATFGYIISLFLINNFTGYIIAGAFLAVCVGLSKVPLRFILNGMKGILFLLLITVIFNLFLTPGTPVFRFWKLQITMEGIVFASKMAIRLIFLIICSTLMTLTTTPNQLTDALESIGRPLTVLHVPVHEVAMMMSIALRFIPILAEETDKIEKAQMARGADFESGNIMQRAKSLIPVLVPLFLSAFRRADELATAMEARCYRGDEGRTKMKDLTYDKRDYIAQAALLASLGIMIGTRYLPGISQMIAAVGKLPG